MQYASTPLRSPHSTHRSGEGACTAFPVTSRASKYARFICAFGFACIYLLPLLYIHMCVPVSIYNCVQCCLSEPYIAFVACFSFPYTVFSFPCLVD